MLAAGNDCSPSSVGSLEIVKIVRLSDIKERMAELGYEPIGGTPEEFAKQIKLDLEKWSAVIRDAQIKVR